MTIIPDRFYFTNNKTPLTNSSAVSFFNLDDSMKYSSFNMDFGPLNISQIFQYVD